MSVPRCPKWTRPSNRDQKAVCDWIQLLKDTREFKTIRVVVLKRKQGLSKGPDGFVDPFSILPTNLHSSWRMIVAMTQVWALGMDETCQAELARALVQEGPMDKIFNLQAAVYGDCPVALLGGVWDDIKAVCAHLFDAREDRLLDDWRLGLLMDTTTYPRKTWKTADARLRRKLHALSLFSPVLTEDGTCLVPWRQFSGLRICVGGVDVCWWVVKILLLPDPKPISPSNPQTLFQAPRFGRTLPGVGVSLVSTFTGPMYNNRRGAFQ